MSIRIDGKQISDINGRGRIISYLDYSQGYLKVFFFYSFF